MSGGVKRSLRQFTFGAGKTAGRNCYGRITSFHRGGGHKRLHRVIDLKRNTSSSVGIVERIEYDPNRSSRIALVRWLNGINPPPQRTTASATAAAVSTASSSSRFLKLDPSSNKNGEIRGVFGLNSLLPQIHAGSSSGKVFLSAFSGKGDESESVSSALGLPRIAVAASRPEFFGVKGDGEKLEIRNWKKNSDVWMNRNKRKTAISWQNIA